jgi:hypothetical protein
MGARPSNHLRLSKRCHAMDTGVLQSAGQFIGLGDVSDTAEQDFESAFAAIPSGSSEGPDAAGERSREQVDPISLAILAYDDAALQPLVHAFFSFRSEGALFVVAYISRQKGTPVSVRDRGYVTRRMFVRPASPGHRRASIRLDARAKKHVPDTRRCWPGSSGAVPSGRRPGPRTVTNAARRGPRP